jgi:UDP-N-acetylmuramyl pentapeptide synthase
LRRFSLLDDTYSSSPEAVLAEIEFLKLEYPERRFSVALGDMLELGHKTEALHKEIGALAYKKGARRLYTFGAYAYLIRDGAREAGMKDEDISTSTEIDDYPIIAKEIYEKSIDSEIVLVKASHSLSSEKIIKEIERLDSEC